MARITTSIQQGDSTTAVSYETLRSSINDLYAVAEDVNPAAITFSKNGYDSLPAQTGPINWGLAASGHIDGIVRRFKLTSDGVNTLNFPASWTVYGLPADKKLPAGSYFIWMVYFSDGVEVSIPAGTGAATGVVNAAPTITLNGANPYTMTVGGTYTEPGYTVTDAEDGTKTTGAVITGTVDTGTAGTYTKTYTYTDAGGLQATATRTVQVNAVANTTPAAPTVTADDTANTLSASHALGTSEIVVSTNGGAYTAYAGAISVGDVARAAGYWKFKIKSATGRNESAVVDSPAFTVAPVTPSIIVFEDTFEYTGAPDPAKWTVVNPNPNAVSFVVGNGVHTATSKNVETTTVFANRIESMASIDSGALTAMITRPGMGGNSQTLTLGTDVNNRAFIGRGNVSSNAAIQVVVGGENLYVNADSGWPLDGTPWKITYIGGVVKFWRYPPSGPWTQIGASTTAALPAGLKAIQDAADSSTFTAATTYAIDNLHLTSQDFTTKYPV